MSDRSTVEAGEFTAEPPPETALAAARDALSSRRAADEVLVPLSHDGVVDLGGVACFQLHFSTEGIAITVHLQPDDRSLSGRVQPAPARAWLEAPGLQVELTVAGNDFCAPAALRGPARLRLEFEDGPVSTDWFTIPAPPA
jgi:hypothetical protein